MVKLRFMYVNLSRGNLGIHRKCGNSRVKDIILKVGMCGRFSSRFPKGYRRRNNRDNRVGGKKRRRRGMRNRRRRRDR